MQRYIYKVEYRNGPRFSSQLKQAIVLWPLTSLYWLQLSWLSWKQKLNFVLSSAGRKQKNAGNTKTNRKQAGRFWCWRSGVMGMGIPYSHTRSQTQEEVSQIWSLFGGIHRCFFTNISVNFKGLRLNFCWSSEMPLFWSLPYYITLKYSLFDDDFLQLLCLHSLPLRMSYRSFQFLVTETPLGIQVSLGSLWVLLHCCRSSVCVSVFSYCQ